MGDVLNWVLFLFIDIALIVMVVFQVSTAKYLIVLSFALCCGMISSFSILCIL